MNKKTKRINNSKKFKSRVHSKKKQKLTNYDINTRKIEEFFDNNGLLFDINKKIMEEKNTLSDNEYYQIYNKGFKIVNRQKAIQDQLSLEKLSYYQRTRFSKSLEFFISVYGKFKILTTDIYLKLTEGD